MNYYQEILDLTPEELKEYISNRIEELELDSKICNKDVETIGYDLDYNPKNQLNEDRELYVDVQNIYGGYIPKGTRMVYGLSYNCEKDGFAGNDGKYYYLDTEDYIYEFCDFIKTKDIYDEFELFYQLQEFIKNYFGFLPRIDREKMFTMIYKDEITFFDPIKEHGYSWFKNRGNAMCSEYAIMAQNILSFFGMDTYIMIAQEESNDNLPENHAFNFISYIENETGKEQSYLIDFAMPISIYNMKFEFEGEFPFLGNLEILDEDFFNKLNDNEEVLEFPE